MSMLLIGNRSAPLIISTGNFDSPNAPKSKEEGVAPGGQPLVH
jgi:hypothetical protein